MEVLVIGAGFGAHVMAPAYARVGMSPRVVSPRDGEALSQALAGRLDLVSVHSPPFLHHEHVMMALDRGCAVLCDKPFGRNAEEARRMRDRAHDLGLLHFVNFELRWKRTHLRLRQLLDEGAIGALQHVSWTMFGDGLRGQKYGWLFDADRAGGWIGAYGAHAIDTLRWLTGREIVQCGGVARTEIPSRLDQDGVAHPATAEDAFSAWFVMDDGCTFNFDTAYAAAVTMPERLVLLGAEGAIEVVDDQVLTLRRPGGAAETFDLGAPAGNAYAQTIDPWLASVRDALRDGRQIVPSFDDGVATTEVLDQLRAAVWIARRS
ncbi:Gfo/Idh/MocA family oxidoreductase [Phenylobacterium sp. LjRoot225]|uniref:Gfo/Idh/MocA family protein n=1 Tax=Phenylobacterium sp. LjRoot225 TaxID=3342285 RepID=UPI003ED10FF6